MARSLSATLLALAEAHDARAAAAEAGRGHRFVPIHHTTAAALRRAATVMSGAKMGWQPIESAPKSTANRSHVRGTYLLGFCPDEGASPDGCVEVIWWEPLTKSESGAMGCWFGQSSIEVRPTHWRPLPPPPGDVRG